MIQLAQLIVFALVFCYGLVIGGFWLVFEGRPFMTRLLMSIVWPTALGIVLANSYEIVRQRTVNITLHQDEIDPYAMRPIVADKMVDITE